MTVPGINFRPRISLWSLCLLAAAIFGTLAGCGGESSPPSASAIIDSAAVQHGSPTLDRAVVSFRFRNDHYRLRHQDGIFHYRRSYTDSLGRQVVDGITNDSTYRRVDGQPAALAESQKSSIHTKVNSVTYFALLPEPLADPAAQLTYAGRDTIDGVPYHRIRVTFRQEGGGEDWQDIFMYWFRTDTYAMDYLAYAYGFEPNEEFGTRFRQAYNIRRVSGVRFADYRNYTVDTLTADHLEQYPDLLARGPVRLVSRVELDSLTVRPL